MRIGQREVGPGRPAYIIAEAGVNHDGDVTQALALVDGAAKAGADAVKFQVFRAAELATGAAECAAYQQPDGPRGTAEPVTQRALLARLELADADFTRIREHCRRRGIEFLATPFSPRDVERLCGLAVPALKIASTDLDNVPLLAAAAATALPLIVSTGAALPEEIRQAVARMRALGCDRRLVLLHCVSAYPTPLAAANLRAVATLQRTFCVPAGFSDHTTDTRTGAWAAAAGACLLEKHFTLDRGASGPDHAMSLLPDELACYVAAVRSVEVALGGGALGMSALEQDVRRVARRSIVAAAALRAGTVLRPEMLAVKRPAGGIAPDQFAQLPGRRLAVDVAADTALTWDMLT